MRNLQKLLGRTVAVKNGGRPKVGRLSLSASNGAIFYAVGSTRFATEAVQVIRDSAVLPVVVLR